MLINSWNFTDILDLWKSGYKIICFGAGANARELLAVPAIIENIDYFVDNNSAVWNKKVQVGEKEYFVFSPERLRNENPEKTLIIITPKDHFGIEKQIEKMNFSVYSLSRRHLSKESFFEKRIKQVCKRLYLDYISGVEKYESEEALQLKMKIERLGTTTSVIVPQVVFILSNKCTLRCKHCSMLMPYFKDPWEIDAEEAIRYIKNFLRGIEDCISFNLVGGETLLYKDLYMIINYLGEQSKIKSITLSTNGTVLPDKNNLSALGHKKVRVFISDYGMTARRTELIESFKMNNVSFEVLLDRNWIAFGTTENRGKSEATRRYEYCRCYVSETCKALYKNMYFACERAARMHMLGNVYNAANDFELLGFEESDTIIRKKINGMLMRETADACNYCDAGKDETVEICAGEQIRID